MFEENKLIEEFTPIEKRAAYERYLRALSVAVKGTGAIFMKRNPKDVFTNNFNRRLMSVHKANHDIQIVIDQVRDRFAESMSLSYTKALYSLAGIGSNSTTIQGKHWNLNLGDKFGVIQNIKDYGVFGYIGGL